MYYTNLPDYKEIKEICHGFDALAQYIIDKYRLETNRPNAFPDNAYVRDEIEKWDVSFSPTGKPFNEERRIPEHVAKKENLLQNVLIWSAKDLIDKHAVDSEKIKKIVHQEYKNIGEKKQPSDIVESGVEKIFKKLTDKGYTVKDVLWNPKMGSDNYDFVIEDFTGDRHLVTMLVRADDDGKVWNAFDRNRDAYRFSDFDHMNLHSAGAAKFYDRRNAPKVATNGFGKKKLIQERFFIPVSVTVDANSKITKFGSPDKVFGQTARDSGLYTIADTMYEFYATHEYYDVPGSKGTLQVLDSRVSGIWFGRLFDEFMQNMGHVGSTLKAMGLKDVPTGIKDLWREKGSYDYVMEQLAGQTYGIMKAFTDNTLNRDVISYANESLKSLHRDAMNLSWALSRSEETPKKDCFAMSVEALKDYFEMSVFKMERDKAGLTIEKMKKDLNLALDRIDVALRIVEARNKEQLEDIAMESKDMMFDAFVRPEYEKQATEELKDRKFKSQAAIRKRTQELLDARDDDWKIIEDAKAKNYAKALYGLGGNMLSHDDINKLYAGGFFQTLLRAIRIDKFFPLKTAGVHSQLPIQKMSEVRRKEDAAMREYGKGIDGIMKEHKRNIKAGLYADDSSFMFNTKETATSKKQVLVRPYNYDKLFTEIKARAEEIVEAMIKVWWVTQEPPTERKRVQMLKDQIREEFLASTSVPLPSGDYNAFFQTSEDITKRTGIKLTTAKKYRKMSPSERRAVRYYDMITQKVLSGLDSLAEMEHCDEKTYKEIIDILKNNNDTDLYGALKAKSKAITGKTVDRIHYMAFYDALKAKGGAVAEDLMKAIDRIHYGMRVPTGTYADPKYEAIQKMKDNDPRKRLYNEYVKMIDEYNLIAPDNRQISDALSDVSLIPHEIPARQALCRPTGNVCRWDSSGGIALPHARAMDREMPGLGDVAKRLMQQQTMLEHYRQFSPVVARCKMITDVITTMIKKVEKMTGPEKWDSPVIKQMKSDLEKLTKYMKTEGQGVRPE